MVEDRSKSLNALDRNSSIAVFGRSVPIFPWLARLAKLPALVALNPPAENPLIRLRLVKAVLLVEFVLLLCKPLDEFVALDLFVKVRLSAFLPNSTADFRVLKRGVDSLLEARLSRKELVFGGGGGPSSSSGG